MGSRYTDILPNGHKVIFGFIVNAHQRAASAEKDLNNQVDRISCLNFSLSPSTSVLAQRADEKDITVADGVCAQTHHNWPGAHYCWMTTLLMVECPHCDPLRWHHSSGGTSQIPGGRWFALDYFHNQEDNTLFLKKLLALGMYLLSLPALFLPKLLIDFQNALIMSWYFVSHCFWPGSWFYSKWNVALGSCSPLPQSSWMDRTVGCPSEDSVPAGGSSLQCWCNVLWDGVSSLNQSQVCGELSPVASIHRSRAQEVEIKWPFLTYL